MCFYEHVYPSLKESGGTDAAEFLQKVPGKRQRLSTSGDDSPATSAMDIEDSPQPDAQTPPGFGEVVRRNMPGAHVKTTHGHNRALSELCWPCVWGGCSACMEVDGGSVVCSPCGGELAPAYGSEVPV